MMLFALFLFLACGGEDATADASSLVDTSDASDVSADETPAPRYPLDDVLRINHIQCKGTHNSYHVRPPAAVSIVDWDYTHAPLDVQLEEQGVRHFELDVHYAKEGDGSFPVFHLPTLDPLSTCATLRECLRLTKAWSDANPRHHIITFAIEPKDEGDATHPITGHYDELDAAILDGWTRERILTPADVKGDHASLREAVLTDGWPTLGATRGMALFMLNDSDEHRANYIAGDPELDHVVMFPRSGLGEPWGSMTEHGDARNSMDAINEAALEGFLVRIHVGGADDPCDDNIARAEAGLASGGHWRNTDYPAPGEGIDCPFEIPNGTPSRCNPITAPPECTSEDIERL